MINLNHTVQEIEVIIAALRKLPMEIAEDIVMKVRAQALPQVQALQAPKQPGQPEAAAEEAQG